MDGKDSTVWIHLLALAMRTEPSRAPECSRTGAISRGDHDSSAGRLALMPQSRRWIRRTVPPARFFKEATGPESAEDEFEIFGTHPSPRGAHSVCACNI